ARSAPLTINSVWRHRHFGDVSQIMHVSTGFNMQRSFDGFSVSRRLWCRSGTRVFHQHDGLSGKKAQSRPASFAAFRVSSEIQNTHRLNYQYILNKNNKNL
ncbi:hypothetical protein, partial [Roseibium sp. RKSG952]|uniref:hypothetical protein n=1 Tax=Roseibium sp. RKSG952 TaxID=2529384 RepID=UPI001AD8B0C7